MPIPQEPEPAPPYSLFPIPYSLFPTPHSLFPIPYSLLLSAHQVRNCCSTKNRLLPIAMDSRSLAQYIEAAASISKPWMLLMLRLSPLLDLDRV